MAMTDEEKTRRNKVFDYICSLLLAKKDFIGDEDKRLVERFISTYFWTLTPKQGKRLAELIPYTMYPTKKSLKDAYVQNVFPKQWENLEKKTDEVIVTSEPEEEEKEEEEEPLEIDLYPKQEPK